MHGVTCGVWPSRTGLVAVVVDDEGRPEPPLLVERSHEGSWALLTHLDANVGLDYALVVPDWLARAEEIARAALTRGVAIWVVPAALVESVRIIARLGTGPPARTAAALARLPIAPALRGHLRRLSPADCRQIPLL